MKYSGIKSFGNIPNNWFTTKLKYILKQCSNLNSGERELLSVYLNYGVIKYSESFDLRVHKPSTDLSKYQEVKKGDFVLNNQQAWRGSVGVSPYDGIVSPAYLVYEINREKCLPEYMNYVFRDISMVQQYEIVSRGVGTIQRNIYAPQLMELSIAIPSLKEQQYILSKLNKTCSNIDSLIDKTKQSITKLEEYKKSLITQAVTKGLDPNVEMKDSGVDWIDYIPKKWNIVKTLFVLNQPITDGPHETPQLLDDGIDFISAEAISSGYINFSKRRGFISKDYYNKCCKKYTPHLNDIYMVKSGATTGRVAIVTNVEFAFQIWSPLAVFRADTKIILPFFLFYALQSEYYQHQVQTNWTYGTQQNIGMRTLEKLKLLVPTINEQVKIVEFLDKEINQIDQLIAKKEAMIVKLEEYKKSLIFEYVTGKKSVEEI